MAKQKLKNRAISKKLLMKSSVTNKTFTYQKGTVSLSFTLNIENPKDLQDFRSLLEAGIADLNEQLEGEEE